MLIVSYYHAIGRFCFLVAHLRLWLDPFSRIHPAAAAEILIYIVYLVLGNDRVFTIFVYHKWCGRPNWKWCADVF